jgi:Asp-tRNA(Asn)/Glu-tRNA(Gln) amidotransferase A subunit family amidase
LHALTPQVMTSGVAAVAAIRNRDCSVAELTESFLARIAEHNPRLNALRDSDADQARQTAIALDARLDRGEDIGPLGGLPVVVKENCDTAGYACSAGLPFRADHRPTSDSWITARLRSAGAVILGTSISDPGAFGVRTAEVTHPADASLTVGGSSGGSAAALAAGLCLGAIGTDTGGSIRIPSACCGTVGLKPTFDALPMTGVFPLVPSLDHVGPMARTVADTALLWSALGVRRVDAPRTVKRVGIDLAWVADADTPIRNAFSVLLDRLTNAGVEVHEIALPKIDSVWDIHGDVFLVESAAWHLARYSDRRNQYPQIAQDGFDLAEAMQVEAYIKACRGRGQARNQVTALFDTVDLIIAPTLSVYLPPKEPETLMVNGRATDYVMALVRQTSLFNVTGHPSLAMPLTRARGTVAPSLQIVGRNGAEPDILAFGVWIEAGLPDRKG